MPFFVAGCRLASVWLLLVVAGVAAAPAGATPHAHHGAHEAAAPLREPTMPAAERGYAAAMRSAFVVGTPDAPLITGPVRGPLAATRAASAHAAAAPSRPAPVDPRASRTALTKAQATKRLSRSCQRLVKVKRPAKLSKRDRKKRTTCLEQRRKLIADSKKQPSTGVNAPATPQPGPSPAAPPITGPLGPPDQVPAPTTPASTTPTATTPSGPTWEPCTPSGSTIGVVSYDAFKRYTLTRACAPAGAVTFNFSNIDDTGSRPHNLFLAAVNAKGEIVGAPVEIVGLRDNGDSGTGTLTVKAGRYLLICTVDGHQGMNTPFQVY